MFLQFNFLDHTCLTEDSVKTKLFFSEPEMAHQSAAKNVVTITDWYHNELALLNHAAGSAMEWYNEFVISFLMAH